MQMQLPEETTTAIPTPVLEVHSQAGVERIRLTAWTHRVGRHPNNDIIIDSPIASRYHLVLERNERGFRLRDMSSNGTWQGSRRVSELQLSERTEFQIGHDANERIRLVFLPAEAGPTKAPPFPAALLEGRGQLAIGRDASCDLVLADPACSRRHALVRQGSDGNWIVSDLGSANGTFVNGRPVRETPLLVGDKIQVGNTAVSFDGRRLLSDTRAGMRVDMYDVTTLGERGQRLLDGVSMSIWPSTLVAVLGASGAGKSTLMGALTGTRPATYGDIRLNGLSFTEHRHVFRTGIGYVPQEDIVHRELTVERALRYAARLRMPPDTSNDELKQRVDTVLHEVGLAERRRAPIWRLSGGQRKRVSIAAEIIIRPPLLLLDEPTSGLDPGLDRQLMILLKRFAVDGQTIVAATHAVGNIDLCDEIIFLAGGGRLAFFGSPDEAREYFATGDFAEMYRAVEAEQEAALGPQRFEGSSLYATNVAGRLPAVSLDETASRTRETSAGPPVRSAWGRLLVLSQRYLEIILRDRGNLAFLLGQDRRLMPRMLW